MEAANFAYKYKLYCEVQQEKGKHFTEIKIRSFTICQKIGKPSKISILEL